MSEPGHQGVYGVSEQESIAIAHCLQASHALVVAGFSEVPKQYA
jgi:hypothetical protein